MVVDHAAFPCDADGCSDVVARDHAAGNVRVEQRSDGGTCARFELILKYDQTEESKFGFDFLPRNGEDEYQKQDKKLIQCTTVEARCPTVSDAGL